MTDDPTNETQIAPAPIVTQADIDAAKSYLSDIGPWARDKGKGIMGGLYSEIKERDEKHSRASLDAIPSKYHDALSIASLEDALETATEDIISLRQTQSDALKVAQDAIIDVRAANVGNFERAGALWEAYDKAVLDCHAAVTAALEQSK